ncbi:hypothetical protein L596_007376 [Steinernema carpocapsae]|uniref:Uncharacterized protein n=1 Tax=Steinernema carpocapsae TaxID=34508 RepID=A0A4U5P927_STECR|nr:hypothetical protein L596_007376 [Steinernema carpocapsae]
MRFDANFLIPEDTRKFLGVESSAVYAHSLSQYQSSSQQVNAPPQPQIQPQQQQQHECIKRKNDDVEDVTAKRLKMDQPDLQEQYWAFEMRMMRS